MTGRRWFGIALLAAGLAGATPTFAPAQVRLPTTSPDAGAALKDLQQQEAVLNDPAAAQEQKDEAAKRLVSRQAREARDILRRVLDNPANRSGQLAVARSLASDANPEPAVIPLLSNLLGPDRVVTEAAAQAMATYRGNDEARSHLWEFARNTRQTIPSRVAVIHAMGKLIDKRAAEDLIALLQSDSNETIRNGICDALVDMTGLRDNGRDLQQWMLWWSRNGNRSEADWAEDLLKRKSKDANELQARLELLRQQTTRFLNERYREAPDPQRLELLLRYLQNDSPEVRALGVQIVYVDFTNGRPVAPEAKQRLRSMVGDSSTEVRQEVARVLGTINDTEAVDALLAQLPQESDLDVRAAIARALGPTHDLRAVEPILTLLNDESNRVSQAAAESLRDLAEPLHDGGADPRKTELANRVALQLRRRLRQTQQNPSAGKLRERIVQAMQALRNPLNLADFYGLLDWRVESPAVRIAALHGLGLIGNPDAADALIGSLSDPDKDVRLAATEALQTTASFAHAEALAKLLDPQTETDPDVRKQIWNDLMVLFPQALPPDLYRWADRFRGDNDLDRMRRQAVLEVLESKLAKENSQEELAKVRQNIGQVLLDREKPAEAVVKFREAIAYWKTQNMPEAFAISLGDQLMAALLRSRNYKDAVDLAEQTIKADVRRTGEIGAQLRKEAERLRDAKSFQDAIKLVEETRRIWTLLGNPYEGQLKFIEEEATKGQTAVGDQP